MARSFQAKTAEKSAEPRLECVTADLGKDSAGSEVGSEVGRRPLVARGLAGSGEGRRGAE